MYTISEASDRLGVRPHVLDYLVDSRQVIPSLRLGRVRVFTEADLDAVRAILERRTAPHVLPLPNLQVQHEGPSC